MAEKTNEKYDKEDSRRALAAAYKVIDDKFGFDIIMLDISDVSVLADYFIIATANNNIQLKIKFY